MQMELDEGLNIEHGLTSIHKYEGILSRFAASRKRIKWINMRGRRSNVKKRILSTFKCSLFISILRKLTPKKESLPNIHIDVHSVSKLSKAMRKLI